MVNKDDWESAYRDVIAQGRAQTGAPTPSKLDAHLRGDLTEDEKEQIGEQLAYYPDLASALHEDAEAEYEPILTDAEVASDWESIQRKMNELGPKPAVTTSIRDISTVRKWQLATAASWILVFALGGVLVSLRNRLEKPRADVERVELSEGVSRGGPVSTVRLRSSTQYVVLSLAPVDAETGDDFRIEIRDLDAPSPQLVWKNRITRGHDGTFTIEFSQSFLGSHEYLIELYAGTGERPLSTYRLRLIDS
jgi:hypothetical protein